MPQGGLMLAFVHRDELAHFEDRPLWLTTVLDAMNTLAIAAQLKQAQKMDKWSTWQAKLVRWLETD